MFPQYTIALPEYIASPLGKLAGDVNVSSQELAILFINDGITSYQDQPTELIESIKPQFVEA